MIPYQRKYNTNKRRKQFRIPFYRLRHAVKPGMAGWALLHQGYARSVEESLIKLQYDLYYIKHQSLWLDLVIILRTIEPSGGPSA